MDCNKQREDLAEQFWQFSIHTYASDPVATLCLQLQDDWAGNVNLALLCFWLGKRGHYLEGSDCRRLAVRLNAWHVEVVMPIRAIRQRLKAPIATVAPRDREAVRANVKALELQIERIEQRVLIDGLVLDALPGDQLPDVAWRKNISRYAVTLGLPDSFLQRLELAFAAASTGDEV